MNEEHEMINEVPSSSSDFRTELAEQLAELAPEAITDGKIDVEKLKELLEGDASDTSERFGLFWPGKKRAMRAAQTPTTATLKPDKENSKDWDTTKNVFIEGDNLEVLKILQKHYHGKIKMIYIDPPYNTGKDFIYPDNYKEGLDTYLKWSKQVNEEGKKLSSNSESEGRYHSNWLNMMYPRLKLARNLLTNDGVLAISIDDSELSNLIALCNEIFGEINLINTIPVKSSETSGVKMSHVDKRLPKVKEYIVFCARSHSSLVLNPVSIPKDQNKSDGLDSYIKYYNRIILNPEDAVENWQIATVKEEMTRRGLSTDERTVQKFKVDNANRVIYRTNNKALSDLTFETATAEVVSSSGIQYVWWEGKQMLFLKDHLRESLVDLWTDISTINLNKETNGVRGFRNGQKPLKLVERLMELSTSPRGCDLILDFFAGSGTTAHAVMNMNAKDGGNRRFVLVQLPEPLSSKEKEQKGAFEFCHENNIDTTISALACERVRRAGAELGGGFRAYKLADTSFTKWRTDSDVDATQLEQHLIDIRESANDDATPDDLLTEILLKQGHSLVEQVRDREIDGLPFKAVVRVDDESSEENVLVLAYLDEHTKPTLEQLRTALEVKPAQFIMLEDSFKGNDELKTNVAQMCKTNGIELWTA